MTPAALDPSGTRCNALTIARGSPPFEAAACWVINLDAPAPEDTPDEQRAAVALAREECAERLVWLLRDGGATSLAIEFAPYYSGIKPGFVTDKQLAAAAAMLKQHRAMELLVLAVEAKCLAIGLPTTRVQHWHWCKLIGVFRESYEYETTDDAGNPKTRTGKKGATDAAKRDAVERILGTDRVAYVVEQARLEYAARYPGSRWSASHAIDSLGTLLGACMLAERDAGKPKRGSARAPREYLPGTKEGRRRERKRAKREALIAEGKIKVKPPLRERPVPPPERPCGCPWRGGTRKACGADHLAQTAQWLGTEGERQAWALRDRKAALREIGAAKREAGENAVDAP